MKNLENYGVMELNAKEIRETDGGFGLLMCCFIAGVVYGYTKEKFESGEWAF